MSNLSTDFFRQQREARQHTLLLLFLYIVGISVMTFTFDLLAFVLVYLISDSVQSWSDWFYHDQHPFILIAILLNFSFGSLIERGALKYSEKTISQRVRAIPLKKYKRHRESTRLRNVVEEMSIASGTPQPRIHVIPNNPTINAFVVGQDISNVALFVTEGALHQLTRDEIQGVVAHEYSHIRNGDMKMNLRLLVLLSGITQFAYIGQLLMKDVEDPSVGRRQTRTPPWWILGALIYSLGYIGIIVARIIKAAISRQREYLADASATQFTRYPKGLGSALIKIAEQGAGIKSVHAENLAHLCIASPMKLTTWFQTHPPLTVRIKRLLPDADIRYLKANPPKAADELKVVSALAPIEFRSPISVKMPIIEAGEDLKPIEYEPLGLSKSEQVAEGSDAALSQTKHLFGKLPAQIKASLYDPVGAKTFCLAQIIRWSPGSEQLILNTIKAKEPLVIAQLKKTWSYYKNFDDEYLLPVLELISPALQDINPVELNEFYAFCQRLIEKDGVIQLREWMMLAFLRHRTLANFRPKHDHLHKYPGQNLQVLLGLFSVPLQYETAKLWQWESQVSDLQRAEPLAGAIDALYRLNLRQRHCLLDGLQRSLQMSSAKATDYEWLRFIAEILDIPLSLDFKSQSRVA